jgi:hypothetical protein
MKTTAELTREQLTDIVGRIQGQLYLDLDAAGNEVWDPGKPWEPDTLDGIAQTLALSRPAPGRRPGGPPRTASRRSWSGSGSGLRRPARTRLSSACRGRDSKWPSMAVFVSIRPYGPPAPKAARKPSFPAFRRPYNDFHRPGSVCTPGGGPGLQNWGKPCRKARSRRPLRHASPCCLSSACSRPAADPRRAGRLALRLTAAWTSSRRRDRDFGTR